MAEGLTNDGWKQYKDLLCKANTDQLIRMQQIIKTELFLRGIQ